MARSGTEILFDSLLKASGIDPEAFKRDIYGTIAAVREMHGAIVSIDARLKRIETALLIVPAEVGETENQPKRLTNGAANG